MDKYNFKSSNSSFLDKLLNLLREGQKQGIDIKDIISKVESVKQTINDDIVRIVLLGSFSDGKTSAIAGLLGRLENSMKIDMDESSDELKVYRPDGLKKGFEIVDTPGLFGTKEKELNGENIKYSDITKKYISEANIVIYVCDAVVPLKDSHVPIIKWIMRDLKKLPYSIFVINKMDEAGYDLTDNDDFNRGKEIKRQNLIKRLRETINLTPQEENIVNIVCIAADPKGKGLAHWFSKSEDYLSRSHINDLRKCLDDVVAKSNAKELKDNTKISAIRDVFINIDNTITSTIKPLKKSLPKIEDSCSDLEDDCKHLKNELVSNKTDMFNQMTNYKAALYADIKGASVESFEEIIERTLGREGDKVTGYILENRIKTIINTCSDNNQSSLKMTAVKFEREFNSQNEFLKNAAKEGASLLKNVKFANTDILKARDMLLPSFKFKPWGATNTAKTLTKGLGTIAVAIGVLVEAASWYQKWKANKDLDKTKNDICKSLDGVFKNLFETFSNEDLYFKNYAPAYIEMQKKLNDRENEVKNLKQKIEELTNYKNKINDFIKHDATDVDYEIIS